MKKLLFSLLLGLMLLGSQAAFSQSFNAGLIAGATFSQVDGDGYLGFHQLGLTGGGYVNLPFSEHFAMQMELKYSQMGARSDVKELEYLAPYNLRLHYAEIPLMLQYDFGHFTVYGKKLDFITLELGLSLDFRLKATEDADGDFEITTSRWSFFSMTGNAGIQFALGSHFGIGTRFMYSMLPCRFNGDPRWLLDHYFNRAIQFTLTYNFYSPLR